MISHQYLENSKSNTAIEFYLPNSIEPPKSNGSIGGLLGVGWDIEEWLKEGNTKLPPFIVRVTGEVEEFYGGFVWNDSSKVEVIFSESAPAYPFKEPASFFGKIIKSIKDEISGVIDDFKEIGDLKL